MVDDVVEEDEVTELGLGVASCAGSGFTVELLVVLEDKLEAGGTVAAGLVVLLEVGLLEAES